MRAQLREYFVTTFDRYESLFETLADDEAHYVKAYSLRHPLIFYYGHTATVFINKLLLTRLINERVDARLEREASGFPVATNACAAHATHSVVFFSACRFRYVVGEEINTVPGSHSETNEMLSEYAEFHYGVKYFPFQIFPKPWSIWVCKRWWKTRVLERWMSGVHRDVRRLSWHVISRR